MRIVSEIKTSKESDTLIGDAITVQANVTDAEQVSDIMEKIQERFGHVDILVNNATVGRYFLKPFLELKWDDFYEKFYDEIKAAYEVTKATLPNMIQNNYGRIVYIATGSPKFPQTTGAIAFGISKAGLVAFSKYIAQEYGKMA
jgi:3-oxoacyl-[acyl-carrier protein] reductase